MFDDRRIQTAAEAMLAQVTVPPLPLPAIQRRIAHGRAPSASRRRFNPLAVAAAAVLAILLVPAVVPGLAHSVGNEIQVLLHWTPPPPAPKHVWQAMLPQTVTLQEAQARVPFTIVPPSGLPDDVTDETIMTNSAGVYSKSSASWSVGAASVTFDYRRRDGRQFTLLASEYDPREGPPSKYIFEDTQTARSGREVVIRHDLYTWRNGSQVMSAVADAGINAQEIVAIRAAMNGTPVLEVWPPRPGEHEKQYRYRLPCYSDCNKRAPSGVPRPVHASHPGPAL